MSELEVARNQYHEALNLYYHQRLRERWTNGNLSYKMNQAQRVISADLRSMPSSIIYRVIECGRGFGKSFLQVILAIEDCLREPNTYPVYIIGPELKQTKEIITPIFDRLTRDAPPGFIRKLKSENKFMVGKNMLILGGFNRDYIDTLRGQRAKSIYIEEARDCDAENFIYGIKDVLLYLIGHSKGNITLLTTTPKDLYHPFLTVVVPKAQLQDSYFLRTIDDNPTLDEEAKALLISEGGGRYSETTKRELYCERVRAGECVVVPSFDESKHVNPILKNPEYGNWILFGDYGGVRDKTWLGIGYYDFPNATFNVVDEAVFPANTSTIKMLPDFARLEAHVPAQTPAGDDLIVPIKLDAPGQILVDLRQEHNLKCDLPQKYEFDWSVNQLEIAFRTNRINIHPRCKFLVTSLAAGMFNKQRTDFLRNEALGHCDAIAGLMYGWHNADKVTCLIPMRELDPFYFLQRYKPKDALDDVAKAIQPKYRYTR